MSSIHRRAVICGVLHFFGTIVLGFMLVGAAASGLSDAHQSEPAGLNIVIWLLLILQAPVALAQWIAVKTSHSGGAGLPLAALGLIAFHSSIGYGYLIAFLVGKFMGKAKHDA
jgi:hypothetical protein